MDLIHACRAKSSESLAVIERLMYKAERDSVRLDSLFLNGRSHLHAIHRGTSLTIQVPLSSRDPLPNGILRKLLKDLVGRVGSNLRPELPLFVFNSDGTSLKLNDKDFLLFGFKGKWEKMLLEQNWQRHPLAKEGLDIDLFTHPTIKQRLVIARNVYGDDANIIMDTFYKKGIRQVIYLGTAGAIADYQVGDVVTPNEFIDNNNVSVSFQENLAHAYRTELSNRVTVHDQTQHGRVPTLYHETLALLLNWKAKSVTAMDVEGFYLARFARSHKDLKMAALFVISDQTLGGSTIDESEARLNLIDESVYKLVSFLLPKILTPQ